MEKVEGQKEQTRQKEHVRLEFESNSRNEEFARVVAAVFMSRLDPTLEETQDVKTAVSEAVTNAIIHGYGKEGGEIFLDMTADPAEKTLTVCVTDTGAGIQDVKKGHGTLIYNGYHRGTFRHGIFLYGSVYG